MSDVSALIGKLKANVAYRQFNAPSRETPTSWPVLERIARAQQGDTPVEAAAPEPEPAPAPPPEPVAVQAPQPVAPPPASPSLSLRRAKPAETAPAAPAPAAVAFPPAAVAPPPAAVALPPAEEVAPVEPARGLGRLVRPPAPAPQAEPAPTVHSQSAQSGGSLLRRYGASPAPSAPEAPAADSRSLSDIFARLEGKAR